jgi:hypothetical protein
VALSIYAIVELSDDRVGVNAQDWMEPAVFVAACWLAFAFLMVYPRKRKPSYERAGKLAQHANLSETGWAALNVMYGRSVEERPGSQRSDYSRL